MLNSISFIFSDSVLIGLAILLLAGKHLLCSHPLHNFFRVYASADNRCLPCHEECLGECQGPGADNCSV